MNHRQVLADQNSKIFPLKIFDSNSFVNPPIEIEKSAKFVVCLLLCLFKKGCEAPLKGPFTYLGNLRVN